MSGQENTNSGPPPGSAEFLASLLFESLDFSCPHSPKLVPGIPSKIPPRLGFFHCTDEDLSYIDTNKLCLDCYNAAVPSGFLCWSAFYAKKGRNVFTSDEEYKSGEPTRGNGEFFPRQLQAGREAFFRKAEPRPRAGTKAAQLLGDLDFDPRSPAYDKRVPSLPPNEDTRAVWRFFQHAKKPFYIDIVHISPPWRGDLGGEAQDAEDARVGTANAAAYLGAAHVVQAVADGGYGPYSVVEQRLGSYGTYRLLSLGPWTSDPADEEALDPFEEMEDEEGDTEPFDRTRAVEVHPAFYPYQGIGAYQGSAFMLFPSQEKCDEVNQEAIGMVLPPTADEQLRRDYEKELPQNPSGILLPPGYASSDPPEDVQSDTPLPRMSDVEPVRWADAERTAYEKGQGLEGVEVGSAYPVESVAGFDMKRPRFMLKPMYKQSSHGIRSDGSLAADPNDFSGNGLNRLPLECRMGSCEECPDRKGYEELNKTLKALGIRGFRDHGKSTFVKRPQQPLDRELWRPYLTLEDHKPTFANTLSDEDSDLILQALSPPRRPVQTGIFQYPRSWYLANGVQPPDTEADELIYGTDDDERQEQQNQQIPSLFNDEDTDSDDSDDEDNDLGHDNNNGNNGIEEIESEDSDGNEEGMSSEDEESSDDDNESEDEDESDDENDNDSEDDSDNEDDSVNDDESGDEDGGNDEDKSDDDDNTYNNDTHHSPRVTSSLVA